MTIDSFMAVDSARELSGLFETELSDDERFALERLCSGLSYLGRAESIYEARLLEDVATPIIGGPSIDPK